MLYHVTVDMYVRVYKCVYILRDMQYVAFTIDTSKLHSNGSEFRSQRAALLQHSKKYHNREHPRTTRSTTAGPALHWTQPAGSSSMSARARTKRRKRVRNEMEAEKIEKENKLYGFRSPSNRLSLFTSIRNYPRELGSSQPLRWLYPRPLLPWRVKEWRDYSNLASGRSD